MATDQPCPHASGWPAMIEGSLSKQQEAELGEHLEACSACRARYEELAAGAGFSAQPCADPNDDPDDCRPEAQPALHRVIDNLTARSPDETVALDCPNGDDLPLDFLEPPDDPEHLGRLGQYEITEVVGHGGMGVVLKGHDPALNRFVAIKVLAPQLASNAVARKRFLREAQAAAAISHDHVVTIHAMDPTGGLPFLVMEFVDGVSLEDRIKQSGPLKLEETLRIGVQTASGLAAAHAQGLVHRDVKPANVLLENGVERVKITDFGLARAAHDAHFTQTGVVAGTPQYMSPEQARGEPVDHRSDLFSLGSVLYAMCTGRSPFRAATALAAIRRVCDDTPRPMREVNSEVPDWLVEIVDRLLAKDPQQRFQSAEEVAELLGGHLAHLQQPALAPRPYTPPAPKKPTARAAEGGRRRQPWAVATAISLLFAALVLTETTGITRFYVSIAGIAPLPPQPPGKMPDIDWIGSRPKGTVSVEIGPGGGKLVFIRDDKDGKDYRREFSQPRGFSKPRKADFQFPAGVYEVRFYDVNEEVLYRSGSITVVAGGKQRLRACTLSDGLYGPLEPQRPAEVVLRGHNAWVQSVALFPPTAT